MRIGVDEAGKGPVLGSMFAAAVGVADPADLPPDVDDSKHVAPERREELAAALRGDTDVTVAVAEVPPERIDDPETDMNRLTVAVQAEAVAGVAESGADLVADAGETNEARFGRRLAGDVPVDVTVTAEHEADERYPIVGAASIVAKVERDAHVERLAERYDGLVDEYGPLGSGYPSDPATRSFLRSYVESEGDLPPFARASWSTCEELLAANEQSGLADF